MSGDFEGTNRWVNNLKRPLSIVRPLRSNPNGDL